MQVRASSRTPVGDDSLPLAELRALGWVPAPGRTAALIAPLGALAVASPVDGEWTTADCEPLRRPDLSYVGTAFLVMTFVFAIVEAAALLANVPAQISINAVAGCVLFLGITTILALGIPLGVWRVDVFHTIMAGRTPLPIVVFDSVCKNVAAIGVSLAAALYLGAYSEQIIHTAVTGHTPTEEGGVFIAGRILAGVGNGCVVVYLAYKIVVYLIFTVNQHRRSA